MTVATMEIAQFLGLSEAELMRRAMVTFLQEQRRAVLEARLEILARYRVQNIMELETQIADSSVAEHPGWEDLITAENLDARLGEIDVYSKGLIQRVVPSPSAAQPSI